LGKTRHITKLGKRKKKPPFLLGYILLKHYFTFGTLRVPIILLVLVGACGREGRIFVTLLKLILVFVYGVFNGKFYWLNSPDFVPKFCDTWIPIGSQKYKRMLNFLDFHI